GFRAHMGMMQTLARVDAVVLPRLSLGAQRINRFVRRRPSGPLTAGALGLALVVGAVVLAQSVGHGQQADQPDQGVRVGVSDGEWIPGYLDASRERMSRLSLAAPDVPVYALVSLRSYLNPEQVAALIRTAVATTGDETSGQLTTVSAKARVPIQGRQT